MMCIVGRARELAKRVQKTSDVVEEMLLLGFS